MSLFMNASPQYINLGVNDLSTSIVTPEPVEIPQHLPKQYFFAKKGSTIPTPTIGAPMLLMYGTETFDKDSKWYNHATRFITGITGEANTMMLQRVIPEDAGPESNIRVYIDIISDDVPNYVRNSDGSYAVDPTTNTYKVDAVNPTILGDKIKLISEYKTAGLAGYKFKLISEYETAGLELGTATIKPGTMTNAAGGTSNMYPILEFKAKYQGEYYNNIGFNIISLGSDEVQQDILTETKSLPFQLQLVTRNSPESKYEVFRSLFGEPSVQFTFKEKAINPITAARFDIEAVFQQNWYNETDRLLPLKYNDYEGMRVYRNNLETVLGMVINNEKQYISTTEQTWDDGGLASTYSWFDFLNEGTAITDAEMYLINFLTGKSTKNVNYFTLVYDDAAANTTGTQKEITLNNNTPVFLNGGSDGTLTNDMFEIVVKKELKKYLDSDSEVMDNAINIESVMYDTGYTLSTKEEVCNFIALRKDTAVGLTTHDASLGEKSLPLSDQRAIAVALKTRLKLTPESSYYGTSVARGIVVAGTGKMPNNSTMDEIPLLYSIALKSAKFMGAGNGKWNGVYAFDKAPGNIITELKDIKPGFIPAGIKPTLWNDGIVWAQPYDREQYHFPGIQTVYDNDTSVLNSWITVIAVCTITKVADDAWRNFTGDVSLTKPQFKEAVEEYVNNALKGRFNGQVVVIPEVVFTEADDQRGYSFHLINRLYANNMKTIMIYTTEAHRMSDLNA